MAVTSALNAVGVSKTYGASQVLSAVNITIARGEILALAGENGSGKSTFAKILAGLVKPEEGEVYVEGVPLPLGNPKASLQAGLSLVPQEVTCIPEMNVADNVLLPSDTRLLSIRGRRSEVAKVQPWLDELGAGISATERFCSLPAASAVIAELARALVTKPKLLVIDETTAYMEASAVRRLFDELRSLRTAGTAMIFISHRLREVCELADRTVVLRDGHVVGELAASETTADRVATMMVGRKIERHQQATAQIDEAPRVVVEDLRTQPGDPSLDLVVRPGEIVGLAGLVNAGCAELLAVLAGAARRAGGTVRVDGKVVKPNSVRAAMANGIVLVPGDRQHEGLMMDAAVRTNIVLGAASLASVVSVPRDVAVASRYISEFHIRPPDPGRVTRLLSGGNQQKVVLARALRSEPRVLLLNEPTRGVDIGARAEVYQFIGRILAEGIGVLMYSTDMQEILDLSHRVLVFYDRHMVGELSGDALNEENVARLMAGAG